MTTKTKTNAWYRNEAAAGQAYRAAQKAFEQNPQSLSAKVERDRTLAALLRARNAK